MIHYTISFEKANQHLFSVKLNINFSLHQGQQFYLPNWIPGSYMIRDFAKNIVTLQANCKGEPVSLEKLDKSTWSLCKDVDCLELCYEVYAWDLSVRSAHLDSQHGFFNGTSLFLGIRNLETEPHHVILNPSHHAIEQNWIVATAMSAKEIDSSGFGKYFANNYEELIDHPFEFGRLDRIDFDVMGVPHEMYFTEAPDRVDWQRIAKDVKKICESEVVLFGDQKPPFERYVFMTFVQKKGFGGLEHMASTALHCSADDLPLLGEDVNKIDEGYRTFLSLCCHEYFHSWNVKRIKPARFVNMDLSKEIHTELLWFFEGITSYYDELLMVRAGVLSTEEYLEMLAQTLTRTLRGRGRFKQTVTQSSFDAWTKYYKQDENSINAIVSYYTKGAMIALCLDLEIRELTNNQKSLDDLMRVLWNEYAKKGRGVGETQIQQLVKELVGQPMNEFFNRTLYSTQELDLKTVFEKVDIQFQLVPQYVQSEKGGYSNEPKNRKSLSYLGITHQADGAGAKVISVAEDACVQDAGLSNGDIIIAINNRQVTSAELDKTIAKIPIGEKILISFFRRERLYHQECFLTESAANTVYLSLTNGQSSIKRDAWLLAK